MNKLSQFLGAAAVIAIAVVFIVQFRPATGAQQGASGPTCAIEVRGSCISSTQFWAAYRLLAPPNADAARLKSMGLRRQTMEGLIDRYLLVEDAKRLGITVSEEDINAELASGRAHVSLASDKIHQLGPPLGLYNDSYRIINARDRKSQKFDPKVYEREVRNRTKMHPTDFRDFQRQELIAERMRDVIRARAHVAESEIFAQFTREKSTATLEYVRLDKRFYADMVVDRSPKAIDAWALTHKDELDKVWENRKSKFLPECRVLRHVLVRTMGADDPDAAKAAAKTKIEAVKARLDGGEDFAAVARATSDDTSSVRGGELGCVTKGMMVKPFEDAAFALEPGKRSDVVETEYGYHIIKLDQIAKGEEAERIGRQQSTLDVFLAQEAERLSVEAAKEILAAVRGGKPLADAVKAHLDAITRSEGPKVAAPQGAGQPGGKPEGKGDGKGEPKGDGKGEPKGDAKAPAPGGEPPTIDTHPGRPAVETTTPFNVSGDPIQGVKQGVDVATIAFRLDKPGQVADDVVPLETGYAIIVLKEKTPASKESYDKAREYYATALRHEKMKDALVGYMKRLRAALGSEVKMDQSLMNEAKDPNADEPPEEEPPQ
ncbi:MAG: peptidylprolyl isomerase [Polyangiaceae bacterium]